MENRKNTGFKDANNKDIYVGDIVKEGCNGLISTVGWDKKKGTYKLNGLGDYYIEDSNIEWEILETNPSFNANSFFNIPQDGSIMSSETQKKIQEYFNIKN